MIVDEEAETSVILSDFITEPRFNSEFFSLLTGTFRCDFIKLYIDSKSLAKLHCFSIMDLPLLRSLSF